MMEVGPVIIIKDMIIVMAIRMTKDIVSTNMMDIIRILIEKRGIIERFWRC